MTWQEIQKKLLEPFPADAISWKPAVTTKGKQKEPITRNGQRVAGCVAHIDARNVMNRLDETVGAGEWSDSYRVIDGKHVECTLTIKGVSKTDVGETNEGGVADPMKSAYSDAFKRAAVKFGIGRHLYEMDMEWLPFDGYKILSTPSSNTRQPASRPAQQPSQDPRGATSPQAQAKRKRPTKNGDLKPPMPTESQFKRMHALGKEVYADKWDSKRAELAEAISAKRSDGPTVSSSKELYASEVHYMIERMEALKETEAA